MSRVRLVPVICILIVSLAVMFGGWRAYLRFNLIDPLESQIRAIPGVKSVQVIAGNPNEVRIALRPDVADLQTTYGKIARVVDSAMSGEQLVIEDNESPALTQAYENFELILLEGLAKGDYVEMKNEIEQKARAMGIQARVTMDRNNVYIQMKKGGAYLYRIWPLHQGGGAS
ncbi:MAG: hypothetical protein IRZ33_06400 [Alicyclobacillaceae bacterium]|nr:hypothetical protein [Alicyclobacillaceae bacterium]